MLEQKNSKPQDGVEILGELHSFAEQLGGPALVSSLTSTPLTLPFDRLNNLAALRRVLQTYCSRVLISCELPAIYRAFNHASRSETRELIDSDCELARVPVLQHFASASCGIGVMQLQRLRPLRGERLVHRYLDAVEHGKAHGWHTVVYGLVLSLYSLPLRQGLLNYGHQTLRGFISSASRPLQLLHEQCDELHFELSSRLPQAVESLLALSSFARSDNGDTPKVSSVE
jgi:urease accessory protein UreF